MLLQVVEIYFLFFGVQGFLFISYQKITQKKKAKVSLVAETEEKNK